MSGCCLDCSSLDILNRPHLDANSNEPYNNHSGPAPLPLLLTDIDDEMSVDLRIAIEMRVSLVL